MSSKWARQDGDRGAIATGELPGSGRAIFSTEAGQMSPLLGMALDAGGCLPDAPGPGTATPCCRATAAAPAGAPAGRRPMQRLMGPRSSAATRLSSPRVVPPAASAAASWKRWSPKWPLASCCTADRALLTRSSRAAESRARCLAREEHPAEECRGTGRATSSSDGECPRGMHTMRPEPPATDRH